MVWTARKEAWRGLTLAAHSRAWAGARTTSFAAQALAAVTRQVDCDHPRAARTLSVILHSLEVLTRPLSTKTKARQQQQQPAAEGGAAGDAAAAPAARGAAPAAAQAGAGGAAASAGEQPAAAAGPSSGAAAASGAGASAAGPSAGLATPGPAAAVPAATPVPPGTQVRRDEAIPSPVSVPLVGTRAECGVRCGWRVRRAAQVAITPAEDAGARATAGPSALEAVGRRQVCPC